MNENYDRSTYLTKVRRIQGRDFDSYSKRTLDLSIKQGGDHLKIDAVRPGARPDEFYEQGSKTKKLMQRLDKNCMQFEKYNHRSKLNSIYREEQGL